MRHREFWAFMESIGEGDLGCCAQVDMIVLMEIIYE